MKRRSWLSLFCVLMVGSATMAQAPAYIRGETPRSTVNRVDDIWQVACWLLYTCNSPFEPKKPKAMGPESPGLNDGPDATDGMKRPVVVDDGVPFRVRQ